MKATLQILDEVNVKFPDLPAEYRRKLFAKYKIFNPANRYLPAVRMGRWDGKIAFFSLAGATYVNLLPGILEYLYNENFDVELDDQRTYKRDFEFDEINEHTYSNFTWPNGEPIVLRDYQVTAANDFLNNQQSMAEISTGSGKTILVTALSERVQKYGRSLVVVPNIDLITQTMKYYEMLGLDVGPFYGKEKSFTSKHTISTWQSLDSLFSGDNSDLQNEFLKDQVAVIVDECHTAKGPLLFKLLSGPLAKIPIRWAVTGTVPKDEYSKTYLSMSLGEVIGKIRAKDLQDRGILSNCNIHVCQLQDYREFPDYHAELKYLTSEDERIEFIGKMINAIAKTGNTLVLFDRKDTGYKLEKCVDNVIFLHGEITNDIRAKHYKEIEESNNKVILATSKIAAVGIDIPRIFNLVFVECGKSFIKTIQSAGRGLRKAHDKNLVNIWDICASCKFSKRHLTARKKFYAEAEYPFKVNKVEWMNAEFDLGKIHV